MRLLIAVAGLPHSEAALKLGAYFLQSRQFTNVSTVLTVIRREADRQPTLANLERARDLLGVKPDQAQIKIRIGRPAEEIVNEATAGKYNLLIIGKAAAPGLLARFMGSTTVQVAEHAPGLVAIASGKISPVRRILVCDSGVHSPSLLNRFIKQLGELLADGVEITVLHVMSQIAAGPQVRGEQLQANAEELIRVHAPEGNLLTQDMHVLKQAHVRATPKVRHGFVVDEILDEARTGNYDLVVIGAHQQERWAGFLLDDLAEQIITKIDRPVLLVR